MYNYGFIGAGNMGSALIRALNCDLKVGISDENSDKVKTLTDELGFTATSNYDVAKNSKYVVLGVKPQMLPALCTTLTTSLKENENNNGKSPIIVTMAAGVKMRSLAKMLCLNYPIIRIMPNTPVAIGQGMVLATRNELVSDKDFDTFVSDFEGAGIIRELQEDLIDAGTALSGCGPAYIYMYMEAMAKAGVELGLDPDLAVTMAQATTRGAASLAEQSDKSLEDLRIAVCSPGGSTIEGVKSFMESNLDDIVKKALECAYKRNKELGGE